MNKKVFFYATLPKKGHIPYGGGEVGNLRTIRMLREAGYEVCTIRQRKARATWRKTRIMFSYPFRLLSGWIEAFGKLLFASRKSIVHLSGFAGKTIFNEYVLLHIMKMLGFRVIYELRGGGAIGFWENGSKSYKKMFSYLISKSCYVFSQGKENIPMLNNIADTPVYHYANCVEDYFVPKNLPNKPTDCINLLFYGRIEEGKHVDLIVETASILQKAMTNVYLSIVGNGKADYIERIKEMMRSMLRPNTFTYVPGCKHEDLPSLLIDKHFYVFPSTQPREGQSNSVTECMAYGIIPIASPQGFNRSTIGDDYLIVDVLTAEAYAFRISSIIDAGKINYYSQYVRNRFLDNYTEKVVFEKTKEEYIKY
jgi:glycosyltransferase involved in cell wall biosynthesis